MLYVMRATAAALALAGMVFSTVFFTRHMTLGLLFMICFVLLYGWAERAFERPRFWLIPGFWLIFSLGFGTGSKGEGIFLGLIPLLLLSIWVKRQQAKKPASDKESEASGA